MAEMNKEELSNQINEALFNETPEQVSSITEQAPPVVEVNKIKVGGDEYTQEELNRLVSLGKLGAEAESRYNTKLDKVYPEFTKKSQRLAEIEKEYETLKSNQNKPITPESEEQAIREAREAAKKLGILTVDDFEQFYESKKSAERLLDTASALEKEIDGTDGRPKFDKIQILEYMRDNGVRDMMTAYKVIHENELDAWKEAQFSKIKKPAIATNTSSSAGASKLPAETKATKDNIAELVAAELGL